MHRSILALAALAAGVALAHESAHAPQSSNVVSAEETPFGRPGDPKRISRTVRVDMDDRMRYTPTELTIRQGETIRFQVRNNGKVMHEMVLGRVQDLEAHAELMRRHPHMEHEDAWMAHVAPGKTESIVWRFTKAGEFRYGCLIPGHFEAGMVGRIRVVAR